jgi:hypothetical protein
MFEMMSIGIVKISQAHPIPKTLLIFQLQLKIPLNAGHNLPNTSVGLYPEYWPNDKCKYVIGNPTKITQIK